MLACASRALQHEEATRRCELLARPELNMQSSQRHTLPDPLLGWGGTMNLFSLICVLLLALAFVAMLLMFLDAINRNPPAPGPAEPLQRMAFCRV